MKYKYRYIHNSGQMVLILILIMMVGLTIGLAVISRTVRDVRITSQIEQSSRAFSAAEAGVESALRAGQVAPTGTYSLSLNQSDASYRIDMIGNTTDVFTFPLTKMGHTQNLWLAEHDSTGLMDESNTYALGSTIDVCWTNQAALVMTLLYKDTDGIYKIAKAAYDPDGLRPNNFSSVADVAGGYCQTGPGTGYNYKVTINGSGIPFYPSGSLTFNPLSFPPAKLIFIRLQPVYFDTSIAIHPSAQIPSQGKQVISIGKTDAGVIRKIQVTQGYFTLPEIFNFAFFDGQN